MGDVEPWRTEGCASCRAPRPSRSRSRTWRAFLENHVKALVAVDLFVVPTVRNRILFAFLILAHDRRRVKMDIEEVVIVARLPWQNGITKRWVQSVRREVCGLHHRHERIAA